MTDQDEMREAIAREREQLLADMARRREQIEREDVLAEARQAIAPATKGAPPPRRRARSPGTGRITSRASSIGAIAPSCAPWRLR
jgi:hypothetical protein